MFLQLSSQFRLSILLRRIACPSLSFSGMSPTKSFFSDSFGLAWNVLYDRLKKGVCYILFTDESPLQTV
jgi:hypothetical protein